MLLVNIETYYELLGVSEQATADEIKSAYHRMINLYHPDKLVAVGPKLKKVAEETVKSLNEAKAVLLDPKRRAEYDKKLAVARKRKLLRAKADKLTELEELSSILPTQQPTPLKCNRCGVNNDVDHLFCKNCGAELARPKYRQPTQIQYQILMQLLQELRVKFASLDKLGIVPEEANFILRKASATVRENQYDIAINYLRECSNFITELERLYINTVNLIKIARVKQHELKLQGCNIPPQLQQLLAEANNKLETGCYREAYRFAYQSVRELDNVISEYNKINTTLEQVKVKINNLESKGINLHSVDKYFKQLQEAMENCDYSKAVKHIEFISDELWSIETKYFELSNIVARVQDLIMKLKLGRANINELTSKLDKLREFMDANDYDSAIRLARTLEVETEIAYQRYYLAQVELERAKSRLLEAEVIGTNLNAVKELYRSALDAMANNNYELALQLSKSCAKTAERLRSLHCETLIVLKSAWLQLKKLKERGYPTDTVEKILAETRKAIADGNYELAINFAYKCQNMLCRLNLQQLSEAQKVSIQ